jgi:choline dehydrogenase-like flavoprotein
MGTDPASSVTNTDARFHHITNAYACDQSIFPTVGSVNPVLTGLALARRLAGHLAAVLQPSSVASRPGECWGPVTRAAFDASPQG